MPREELSVGPHARPSTVVFTPETTVGEAARLADALDRINDTSGEFVITPAVLLGIADVILET